MNSNIQKRMESENEGIVFLDDVDPPESNLLIVDDIKDTIPEPITYDLDRMRLAIAGPYYTMPSNLTEEQYLQWMKDVHDGKVLPDGMLRE